MSKNVKVVVKDAEFEEQTAEQPVEAQDTVPEAEEAVVQEEVKHTIFGKLDQKILDGRAAKAKKKAEKQPKTKAEKAAMIGGGVALGVGVLGLVGKALLGAAASYADEDSDGGYSDDVALLDGEVSEAADSVELETANETTEDVEA